VVTVDVAVVVAVEVPVVDGDDSTVEVIEEVTDDVAVVAAVVEALLVTVEVAVVD